MATKKKELFKRKDPNCTSFRFILCGDALVKVNEFKKRYYDKYRQPLGNEKAIIHILEGFQL